MNGDPYCTVPEELAKKRSYVSSAANKGSATVQAGVTKNRQKNFSRRFWICINSINLGAGYNLQSSISDPYSTVL